MNKAQSVEIIEVSLRDGFQSYQKFIPTELKAQMARDFFDTGLKHIELTTFARPDKVEQLRDAEELVKKVLPYARSCGGKITALVPNKKGFERAIESGVDRVTMVISSSDKHNLENVGRTIDESLCELKEILNCGYRRPVLNVGISMAFGASPEYCVKQKDVLKLAQRVKEIGADTINLADTNGYATPERMEKMLSEVDKIGMITDVGLHLHGRNPVLRENVITAIKCGINRIESAIGGIGGCQFSPDIIGNLPTEELVDILLFFGIDPQIDIQRLQNIKKKIVDISAEYSCNIF